LLLPKDTSTALAARTHRLALEDISPATNIIKQGGQVRVSFLGIEELRIADLARPAEDPFLCPRASQVTKIAEIIDSEWLVHIRGTPASGKITLAYLLFSHYRSIGTRCILLDAWSKAHLSDYRSIIVQRAHDDGYTDITRDNLRDSDFVIIFDEAQMTYSDSGLWLGLVKGQNGRCWGPRICVLTSFGNPMSGPESTDFGSPMSYIGIRQRVSITISKVDGAPDVSLFYTREEFDDAVKRQCGRIIEPVPLATDAIEYFWSLSRGHPGVVNGLVRMASMVRTACHNACQWANRILRPSVRNSSTDTLISSPVRSLCCF
jgi:hypothetical protein